ncbi:hypothetical protein ACWY4P_46275 [Streptomyces sp. LZ34]
MGRFALSKPYALFFAIHPDGDAAYLLDVNPASSTYRRIVGRVPLHPLPHGPQEGKPAAGTQRRSGAITPAGDLAFVSHGGDGLISVIDTRTRRVTKILKTPTPLAAGGYLTTVQPKTRLTDLIAR